MEKDSSGKSYSKKVVEEELLRLHPDYNDISDNDDFHQWAEKQPKWVQEAIYENNWDVLAAARALDLYKKERNINSNKSSNTKNKDKVKSDKKAETSLGKSKARIAAEVEASEAAKEADNNTTYISKTFEPTISDLNDVTSKLIITAHNSLDIGNMLMYTGFILLGLSLVFAGDLTDGWMCFVMSSSVISLSIVMFVRSISYSSLSPDSIRLVNKK